MDSNTLQELRRLHHQGKLIPFIGAGFSARFGLPTWSALMELIAEDLGWDPQVFKLSGNYLQLAEYHVRERGSIGPLRRLMDQRFTPPEAEIKKSETHEALVQLGFQLIYTTNYDDIIERAFKLHGRSCHRVSNIDDIARTPKDQVTQVVKFHGTFDDDDSLVLTESSYFERLEFESAIDIKFRSDILGKSLLFMGYGFNASDINIRYILYKLNKLRQREHRLSTGSKVGYLTTFASNDIQRKLLESWNIEVIELDPVDKNKSLLEFLRALQ